MLSKILKQTARRNCFSCSKKKIFGSIPEITHLLYGFYKPNILFNLYLKRKSIPEGAY